jgi:mRNA deadenylase 3'-5' endonuclease subunit Ccr4
MLIHELFGPNADVLCLQVSYSFSHEGTHTLKYGHYGSHKEVDRLEKIIPALESRSYLHVYAAGNHKKHGCLIAFKAGIFDLLSSQRIEYDAQPIRSEGIEGQRIGRSFNTKNIASLVALRNRTCEKLGLIVATTHLFWHPKYKEPCLHSIYVTYANYQV